MIKFDSAVEDSLGHDTILQNLSSGVEIGIQYICF
jgi:hypothetical protein